VVSHLLWHFNIFSESLSFIGVEARGINLELETEAINNLDLSGRKRVELGHSLNFDELYIVAILEFMTLIFMNCNNARIGLCSCHNNE
jgi:hypothetical protein